MANIKTIGKKAGLAAYKIVLWAYRIYIRLFGANAYKIYMHCFSIVTGDVFDKRYLDPNVPIAKIVSHDKWFEHLVEIGNHKGMKILEIGSREFRPGTQVCSLTGKTGNLGARKRFTNAQYVGFDYYPGENVDIVGDAHKLSQYFNKQEFDIIFSSACFEHFAMPWIVAAEIAKILKVGGCIFVETHFSYGSHERPWHFFQFSDMALRTLFSPAMGFECIEAGASNPMIGRFSSLADDNHKFRRINGLYCHSEYLGRKIKEIDNFDWNDFHLDAIVGEGKYPAP